MKNQFGRTKIGKALLLIGCALALSLFVFCLAALIYLFRNDFYSETRNNLQKKAVEGLMIQDAEEAVREVVPLVHNPSSGTSHGSQGAGNLRYQILRYYTQSQGYRAVYVQSDYNEYVSSGTGLLLLLVFYVAPHSDGVYYKTAIDALGSPLEAAADTTGYYDTVLFQGVIRSNAPALDRYFLPYHLTALLYTLRYALWFLLPFFLAAAVWLYIRLLKSAAARPGTTALFPGKFHAVPFDLMFLAAAALLYLFGCLVPRLISKNPPPLLPSAAWDWRDIVFVILCVVCFLALSVSAAARIKLKNLWKNCFLRRLICKVREIVPHMWKVGLALLGVFLLDAFLFRQALLQGEKYGTAGLILLQVLVLSAIFAAVFQFKKLKEAAAKLAEGNLGYKIDTRGMLPGEKELGENLNRLGDGLNTAVEERLKSERMKTELFTNVSHDIRTPLTSIISYTELLKKEDTLSQQGKDAVDVLSRQSDRLKRLIDDLVEASKASSGALEVELAPCDAAVFVTQAAGEYEEQLKEAGLTLLTRTPEEPLRIRADGRRMQRIFDNLMNNIRKYALPGTRVYLDLEKKGQRAVFLFKNTSREPLNITASELMERFVRGDSSRHTEGNGLGLSIAQSLAELQGGTLLIQIDGDLFKAVLSFPALE